MRGLSAIVLSAFGTNAFDSMVAVPRAPVVPVQYPAPAQMRPFRQQQAANFGPMGAAPELTFVSNPLPAKLQQANKRGLSLENYNSVQENGKGWGIEESPNGRGLNLYPGAKIPEVGERPQGYAETPVISYRGYKPGPQEALFGNERYELLKNGLKAEVTDAFDTNAKKASEGPKLAAAQSEATSSLTPVAMLGLFMASWIGLAVLRSRRGTLPEAKEPLILA